jgi:thymidylate synthase (FAD)
MADMKVELIDRMGSDLSVVNAARVSFDKESEWVQCEGSDGRDRGLSAKDKKLIQYLADHNHWSPFSHAFVSFRIKAPLFVARQLAKHQVGLAWNEVSRRYVDSEPEFYQPYTWRKRAGNVKQGSGEKCDPVVTESLTEWLSEHHEVCLRSYNDLIENGICPEQARMVLPQSMMTEWIWSGSLFAFARVCKLRLDSHTQKETQTVAEDIARYMQWFFPVSWKALNG